MNLEPGTVIAILTGVLTAGVSWGMVTTRLGSSEKDKTKTDGANERDHVKLEQRADRMEREITNEIKGRCEKFEHELEGFENRFETCKESRESCRASTYNPIWDYLKGPDGMPRFVPMLTYEKDKDAFIERLKAIEEKATSQHREIMDVLGVINKNTGK